MGIFKDLRQARKQAKELQRQAGEQSGMDTSLMGMLRSVPDVMSQASESLQQVQSAKAESDRLRAQGTPGVARLVAVRDTGMTIGGAALGAPGQENPVAELTLEVTVGDAQPYPATINQMVPRLAIGRLIPGSQLPVKVDPLDPANLLVDWEAPLPG